jgi:hypothetical protein
MRRSNRNLVVSFGMAVFTCVALVRADTGGPVVKDVRGEAGILSPDAGEFGPVEKGRNYPWGSRLKTGKDAMILMELPAGGEVRVTAESLVQFQQTGRSVRVMLEEGNIQVALAEEFHRRHTLSVETRAARLVPTGSRFTAGVDRQDGMTAVVADVEEGTLKVDGKGVFAKSFDIPLLKAGDRVSVALSDGRDLLRVKNHGGRFEVRALGPDGNKVSLALGKDQFIRISLVPSEDDDNKHILTLSHLTADGLAVLGVWTASVDSGKMSAPMSDVAQDDQTAVPGNPRMLRAPAQAPLTPAPRPRPTPTPVGDR